MGKDRAKGLLHDSAGFLKHYVRNIMRIRDQRTVKKSGHHSHGLHKKGDSTHQSLTDRLPSSDGLAQSHGSQLGEMLAGIYNEPSHAHDVASGPSRSATAGRRILTPADFGGSHILASMHNQGLDRIDPEAQAVFDEGCGQSETEPDDRMSRGRSVHWEDD